MVSLEKILFTVTNFNNATAEEVFKNTRQRHIVTMRQQFFYLARELNGKRMSLQALGAWPAQYGSIYDHSTVLHGINQMKSFIKNEPESKAKIDTLKRMCYALNQDEAVTLKFEQLGLIHKIINTTTLNNLRDLVQREAYILGNLQIN